MNDFEYSCHSGEIAVIGRNPGNRRLVKPCRTIKDMPIENRPRERLLSKGPESLSDLDLLTVVLNTGTRGKNVTVLAEELLALLDSSKEIPTVEEISGLSGLGEAKTCAIAAMLEFGFRRWGSVGKKIRSPADIYSLVSHYADRKQERFLSISLNGAHEAVSVRVVTVGLVNRTIVHPREVFADLIQDRAAAFCVAHNHPSGQLVPSPEDDEITLRLQHSAEILGIHFLDHLIFSEKLWWSYRQNNRINCPIQI
jgi:DNA repair protein RadC